MKKKQLLKEETIRRFQALANIPALNEADYFSGLTEEEDEEMEMGLEDPGAPELEGPPPEMGEPDVPPEDLGMDAPAEGETTEVSAEMVEDIVRAVIAAIKPLASQVGTDLEIEEDPADVGDEAPELDLGAEEPPADEPLPEPDLAPEDEGEDVLEEFDLDENVVSEIYKRVAARLTNVRTEI